MEEKIINRKEIYNYIDWLESEIDRCLACDLPFVHIEKELNYYNKLICNQIQPELIPVSSSITTHTE